MSEYYKRSLLNMNFGYKDHEFIMINKLQMGFANNLGGFKGQTSSGGYPQDTTTQGYCQVDMASIQQYSGDYILAGEGTGTLTTDGAFLTYISNLGTVANPSAGVFNVTQGSALPGKGNFQWYIVLRRADVRPAMPFNFHCQSTVAGQYLNGLAFFRADDESDLLAGNYVRTPWKQMIVDMNPGAIRFMAPYLSGPYAGYVQKGRWRDRTPPNWLTWQTNQNILEYGAADQDATGVNFVVTGVAGTPASMSHLEICQTSTITFQVGHSDWYTTNGTTAKIDVQVSNITSNGVNSDVTTIVAHGFNIGDTVIFTMAMWPQIANMVGVIQAGNFGASTFSVNIDSSSWGAFPGSNYWGRVGILLTLQVGSGNDRTPYPIMNAECIRNFSANGPGWLQGVQTFVFDKNIVGKVDPDGTKHWGCWIVQSSPNAVGSPFGGYHNIGEMPCEMISQFINELEDMIIAQNKQATHGPINPWICVPHSGMLSIDPDYDPLDNYAVGMLTVMLNDSSGFRKIPSRCQILVEYANETFNYDSGPQRYNSAVGFWQASAGWQDLQTMSTIRACNVVYDLANAFPGETRIVNILGSLWDYFGLTTASSAWNVDKIDGNSLIFAAASITPKSGTGNLYPFGADAPMQHFAAFASAPYLDLYMVKNYGQWFAWDSGTTYAAWNGSYTDDGPNGTLNIVVDDNVVYTSKAAGNLNNRPKTDGGVHWNNIGNYEFGINKAAWLAAGGLIAVSSVSAATNAVITTTGAHTFNDGELVIFTDIQGASIDAYNPLLSMAACVVSNSNQGAGTFTINLDTTYMGVAFISGNVVCINRPSQEQYCASYLQGYWHDDTPNVNLSDANAFNAHVFRVAEFSAKAASYGAKFYNYEGWEQLLLGYYGGAQGLSNSWWNVALGLQQDIAFFIGCKRSQANAAAMTSYLQQQTTANSGLPAILDVIQEPWGVGIPYRVSDVFPNSYTYSLDGAEWDGLSAPWFAMQNFNLSFGGGGAGSGAAPSHGNQYGKIHGRRIKIPHV